MPRPDAEYGVSRMVWMERGGSARGWGAWGWWCTAQSWLQGKESLFLGSNRAHLRKRSVCLHSGLCTSPKSLPLHLRPRWPLDVPASIKDEPSKALRDFPLCLFLPPLPPPPFESMGVASQRQSVNKCRWCKGSDGAEKRESAGLKR